MTLEEIAKLAGVSKTTASYVINGKATKYRISQKTQQKVMAVVDAHNYRPDHAASALRAGSSHSFGLVIPDIENASYARLAKLLEQNSRIAGYQLLIGSSDDEAQTEKDIVHALLSRRIDALFVASCLIDANDFYLKIQQSGTPVIALDRPLDDEHFACVISEDFSGAYDLTRSLAERDDVQSLGLIGAKPDLNVSKERQLGFEAIAKALSKTTQIVYAEHFQAQDAHKLVKQWIANKQLPDAIVTTSYTLMEGVLDALFEHGEFHTQVALATFGDNRMLDFLPVKVNALPQQFEIIADSALALALNAIGKRYQSGIELVPRRLHLRAKTQKK